MPRDYKKEAAWLKGKYTDLRARLDKDLAEQLKSKLADQGITYAQWLKKQIEDYLQDAGD